MAKFLEAAADVFSKHGYEGSTIRVIAKKARVNLGTLNHYWGSKQELFRELFELRFRPLQREHLRRLRAVEAGIESGSIPAAIDVLRCILEPVYFIKGDSVPGAGPAPVSRAARKRFHALYGRALMDPSPHVICEMAKMFAEPVQLFVSLMRLACPDVSAAEIDWRVNCVMGAQVFAEVYDERGRRFFGDEADVDEALAAEWILHFLMNGLNAAPCGSPVEARPAARRRAAKA